MTVQTFLAILTILATCNSLFTQAVKKLLDTDGVKYSSNIVAAIDSVCVGFVGMFVYYYAIVHNPMNWVFTVLMVIAVWCGSMVGYDKITQLMKQIEEATGNGIRRN